MSRRHRISKILILFNSLITKCCVHVRKVTEILSGMFDRFFLLYVFISAYFSRFSNKIWAHVCDGSDGRWSQTHRQQDRVRQCFSTKSTEEKQLMWLYCKHVKMISHDTDTNGMMGSGGKNSFLHVMNKVVLYIQLHISYISIISACITGSCVVQSR